MEPPHVMLLHTILFAIVSFLIMFFILGQSYTVAMNRTLILSSIVLIYMVLFGHGTPTKLNPGIFK